MNATAAPGYRAEHQWDAAPVSDQWECCWEGCEAPAAYVVFFRGQRGHVHDCVRHTAILREWADIVSVTALPCLLAHGATWCDAPPALV